MRAAGKGSSYPSRTDLAGGRNGGNVGLKEKLTKNDSVIAEISEEYVVLKKTFGGT